MSASTSSLATNWNTIAPIFDTKAGEQIDPRAADNIMIAWPCMVEMMERQAAHPRLRVLDFGCGTGSFSEKLHRRGHDVVGIDPAENMIALAIKQTNTIPFIKGTVEDLAHNAPFDAIVASMVLQFVDESELEPLFTKLLRHLKPTGKLVFAVHNPEFLEAAMKSGPKFFKDSQGQLHIQFKEYGSIKLYARSCDHYKAILEKLGMKSCETDTPPFTQEFKTLYGNTTNDPLDIPKFLIMSLQKGS